MEEHSVTGEHRCVRGSSIRFQLFKFGEANVLCDNDADKVREPYPVALDSMWGVREPQVGSMKGTWAEVFADDQMVV